MPQNAKYKVAQIATGIYMPPVVWEAYTAKTWSSAEFKALSAKLAIYHEWDITSHGALEEQYQAVKTAFKAWVLSKDSEWTVAKSSRSKQKLIKASHISPALGAPEVLESQLNTRLNLYEHEFPEVETTFGKTKKMPLVRTKRSQYIAGREAFLSEGLKEMFTGKHLEFKRKALEDAGQKLKEDLKGFAKQADPGVAEAVKKEFGSAKTTIEVIDEIVCTVLEKVLALRGISEFFKSDKDQVVQLLLTMCPDISDFAFDALPFFGTAKAAKELSQQVYNTCRAYYRLQKAQEAIPHVERKIALRAAVAVQDLMRDKFMDCAKQAAVQAAHLAVKATSDIFLSAASSFVHTGASVVAAAAKFAVKIASLWRLVQQKNRANKLMLEGRQGGQKEFAVELFDACPLLACYYLNAVPPIDLIAFTSPKESAFGWYMTSLAIYDIKVKPCCEYAKAFIDESPFSLCENGRAIDLEEIQNTAAIGERIGANIPPPSLEFKGIIKTSFDESEANVDDDGPGLANKVPSPFDPHRSADFSQKIP